MARSSRPKVTLIFPEQYPEAAKALGRAFVDDPVTWALLPDIKEPAVRARQIERLFSVVLDMHRRHGQPVLGVVEAGAVVAAAVIEGVCSPTMPETVLGGLREAPEMLSTLGIAGTVRAMRLADVLLRNRPDRPHIYLNLLGVDPDYQRRHLGIAILDYLQELAALRPELAGVYLETATQANVAYYTRAGYHVLGEILPVGVRMWRMMQSRGEAKRASRSSG